MVGVGLGVVCQCVLGPLHLENIAKISEAP